MASSSAGLITGSGFIKVFCNLLVDVMNNYWIRDHSGNPPDRTLQPETAIAIINGTYRNLIRPLIFVVTGG